MTAVCFYMQTGKGPPAPLAPDTQQAHRTKTHLDGRGRGGPQQITTGIDTQAVDRDPDVQW